MDKKAKLTHARLQEILDYDPETGIFKRKVRKSDLRKDEVITHERLREVLEYDPATGVFVWKIKTSRKVVAGTVAGFEKATGSGIYRYLSIDGSRYLAHRLAWFWVKGEWPRLLKFKDNDSLNCSFDNLEDVGTAVGAAKSDQGYLYVRVDGIDYLAARLAWFWVHKEWPSIVRFRDGNKENIRIANLRDPAIEPAYSRTDQGQHEARKAYYENNRDRARDLSFQRQFGITLAEYNRIYAAQNYVCAICGNPETTKRNGRVRYLAVDHCHTSNKVRGLLCGNCNPMIGYARDSVTVLERAISYLRSYA